MLQCTNPNFEGIIYICPKFAAELCRQEQSKIDLVLDSIAVLLEDCLRYLQSSKDGDLANYISEEPSRIHLGTFLRGEGEGLLVRVGRTVDTYCSFCFNSKKLKVVHAKLKNMN